MSLLSSGFLGSRWRNLPPRRVQAVSYAPPLAAGGTGPAVAVAAAQQLPADFAVLPGGGPVQAEEACVWNLWRQTFADPAVVPRPGGLVTDAAGARWLVLAVGKKLGQQLYSCRCRKLL